MHRVFSDRILYEPGEDCFVFLYVPSVVGDGIICEWKSFSSVSSTPFTSSIDLDVKHLQTIIKPFEIEVFLETSERKIARYVPTAGVFREFLSGLRNLYSKLGFYSDSRQTYHIPHWNTPCLVSFSLKHCLYGKSTKSWSSGMARDAIRALNDGIIWSISIDKNSASKELTEYFQQSHSSPIRIAEALARSICGGQDLEKGLEGELNGRIIQSDKALELRIPMPSFLHEVPLE